VPYVSKLQSYCSYYCVDLIFEFSAYLSLLDWDNTKCTPETIKLVKITFYAVGSYTIELNVFTGQKFTGINLLRSIKRAGDERDENIS
jgi:hypothetical protein